MADVVREILCFEGWEHRRRNLLNVKPVEEIRVGLHWYAVPHGTLERIGGGHSAVTYIPESKIIDVTPLPIEGDSSRRGDTVILEDQHNGKPSVFATATITRHSIALHFVGYGDKGSEPGHGKPVLVEVLGGKLFLKAWADINEEDPTNSIDMSGALESNRIRKPDQRADDSMRNATINQFVAEFFANRSDGIDYSELEGAECWNGYVETIANIGALLEDVTQEVTDGGKHEFASWYDVLEEAAAELRKDFLTRKQSDPDREALRGSFRRIVKKHLEYSGE